VYFHQLSPASVQGKCLYHSILTRAEGFKTGLAILSMFMIICLLVINITTIRGRMCSETCL